MATYTVQAPDGKTITLEGPEGASHEEVISQAKKLYTPKQEPSSTTKAAAKAAVEHVGAGVGGWAGMEAGGAAGAALGTAIAPGVGTAIGGIVGGAGGAILGGALGEKAQETLGELVPESVKEAVGFGKEQRQQERREHPIATTVSGLATELATGGGLAKAAPKIFEDRVAPAVVKQIWGDASPIQKASMIKADEWGMKLKPGQVTEEAGQRVVGTDKNQLIVNRKAAEATGVSGKSLDEVSHIDNNFLNTRFRDLGNEYEKVYGSKEAPKNFKLDHTAYDGLAALNKVEGVSLPATTKKSLERMLESKAASTSSTLKMYEDTSGVSGLDFRNVMSELKKISMNKNSPAAARTAASDLIGTLNESLAKNNPSIKEALDVINPKYRATATLQKGYESNSFIDQHGNISAFDMGRSLRGDETNPLHELGQVGETLGIGRKGVDAKRSLDITAKDVLKPVSGVGKALNIGRAATTDVLGSALQRRAYLGTGEKPSVEMLIRKYMDKYGQ